MSLHGKIVTNKLTVAQLSNAVFLVSPYVTVNHFYPSVKCARKAGGAPLLLHPLGRLLASLANTRLVTKAVDNQCL